jgi:hypothetical protein
MISANLNKRLEKLEGQRPSGNPIFIWVDEGDTEVEALAKWKAKYPDLGDPVTDGRNVVFFTWNWAGAGQK